MTILTEKEAEEILEKEGFKVVKRKFVSNEDDLKKVLKIFSFPVVLKINSKTIIHKNRVGGVKTNVENLKEAVEIFRVFKKIKGFEGVVVQEQVEGAEFIVGVKKTPEFGHVILFGAGGTKTEELKDVAFRVYPIEVKDSLEMIEDVKVASSLNKKQVELVSEIILKLSDFIYSHQDLKELDINPLMVNEKEYWIADARMVF